MTAYTETASGLAVPNRARLTESTAGYSFTIDLLEAKIIDLERQLAEEGWTRLDPDVGSEFSREAIGKIVSLARVMYLKNPLIRRAVEIGALYVYGQDLSTKADDAVKPVIDRFDADNANTLTGQQASRSLDVELRVTGNLFLAFFADPITGAVKIRQVPIEEITEIVTNPDDRFEPWFYRRCWSEKRLSQPNADKREALYPHIDYRPDQRPASIVTAEKEIEIRWDAPIDHVKVGSFGHWRWGVSEVYAAIDWARAYNRMLENDATRSAGLARWVWLVETPGGKQEVTAIKNRLSTTLGSNGGYGGETNPPPAPGSTAVLGGGNKLSPFNMSSAILPVDHSRPARLMVAAAAGLPDAMLSGDGDQGSLATSKSLDRPTELQFSEDRELWVDKRKRWYQFAIDADLTATRGLLPKSITADQRKIDLEFPDLLEPDVTARVTAVNTVAQYLPDELVTQLAMSALGVEDIDGWLEKMATQRAENAKKAEQISKQAPPPVPPVDPNKPQPPDPTKQTEAKRAKALDLAGALAFFDKVNPDFSGLLDAAAD